MERFIIHLNIADFAVAVERLVNRRLCDRPVLIAPEGAARAAVYDMSDEAYRAGVRKGMALRRARRIAGDAAILAPHPDRYEHAMRDLLRRALPFSPLIEPGERDGHLFVDITGTSRLFGPPVDVAWRLRRQIKTDLGLDPIWSVASNKLVAKVATRLVKPLGEYIVAPGEEEAFLAPVPVWLVPGIEKEDLIRLREFNLLRVSQVNALTLPQLTVAFGKRAGFLHDAIRGRDNSPVQPVGRKAPQIVLDREFGDDTNDRLKVEAILYTLIEQAGRALRRQQRAARSIGIIIDYSDGMRCARQAAAKPATANDLTLFEHARRVLNLAWARRVRIRHMRLVCGRLVFPPAQMPLFPAERDKLAKHDKLTATMDHIRSRFGHDAVRMGRAMAA
ncbi:MAG: hypothetical protein HKM93_04720 [Desulfobacteraceae bacterium]|nr:hypothetical protein [Desulfobacteraceae bacterium]